MPAPIRIDDPDDLRLEPYSRIRERDLVRRDGRFIAEGTVVMSMLASPLARRNGFAVDSLLILENRLAGLADMVSRLDDSVPVYVVGQTVMDRIAGFHLHRGVLALGVKIQQPDRRTILDRLPASSLVVAACGISNHDNIGAIFRNAAAFGADAVLLDEECCDPLYRKALRVSVGTVLAIPFARQSPAGELVGDLARADFAVWGLSPRGHVTIEQIEQGQRIALLLGTEGDGLPPEIMSAIATARIRQRAEIDSLNVATASGIALHAIAARMGRI